jgi:hypothetical protein
MPQEPDYIDLGGDCFFLSKSQSTISFAGEDTPREYTPKTRTYTKEDPATEGSWVPWYPKANDFPATCIEHVTTNNILFGVLSTKVEFLLGQELILTEKTITPEGKRDVREASDPEIQAFIEANDLPEILRNVAIDKEWFGLAYVELVFNQGGEVASVRHIDASTVRKGYKNRRTRMVDWFFVCPDWKNPVYEPRGKDRSKNNVIRVPAFDPSNPTRYAKCIMPITSYMPGHPNYPLPFWYPTSEWIRLATRIPRWHRKGMDSGYNIRYHVEIPQSWIEQFPPNEREMKKSEVRANMDSFLSGAENNGKTFFSTFSTNGATTMGWKITPLDTKLNDAAYTALFTQSNIATVSGLGIDPTLAGIMMEGKMGNASEKRIAYGIHMALKTPRPRQELLKFLHTIAKINGWNPAITFAFRDIEITTLDQAPTGHQSVTTT